MVNSKQAMVAPAKFAPVQNPLEFFNATQNLEDSYIQMLNGNKSTSTKLGVANKAFAVSSVKLDAVKKNL